MSQSSGAIERLHGLDALRGGLLLLGVVQHATGPFVPLDQYWVVRDINQTDDIALLSFVIHTFRMVAFFVLAGLFARMGVHRLSTRGFALDRLRRILLPLIVGWCAVIPATLALSEWTMVRSYGPDILRSSLAAPTIINLDNIPLQHFWFLYVLSLLCATVVLASWATKKIDPDFRLSDRVHSLARRVLSTPLAIVLLAVPATLVLGSIPDWTAIDGIPTPNVGLFHVVRPYLIYGFAFAVGWTMHRHLDLAQTWVRWWPWCLSLAVVLTAALIIILALTAADAANSPSPNVLVNLGEAALYSTAGWAWTFALIGLSLRLLSRASAARRYLADSSYWIYLVHPPLLFWLGDAMRNLDWPAWLKLLIEIGVAMPLLLASYQLIVRHSFIGTVLNGKRPTRTALRPAQV